MAQSKLTFKSPFQLIKSEIDKSIAYSTKKGFSNQLERSFPFGTGLSDVSAGRLVTELIDILSDALPATITEGLLVTANNPANATVLISPGTGTAAGFVYSLEEEVSVPIPFDSVTSVFFINLYKDSISVDKTLDKRKLTIAKIVVPEPGSTSRVIDDRDLSWDAYIQNYTEYKLYGNGAGKFEEDSREILRANIGDILADNLIGNLRLSENLTITNITNSLELNSDSLKIKDEDGNVLSKFTQEGVRLYNSQGHELAKFTGSEARIGNISILADGLQSGNFVEGSTGFRIQDNGDVEFNDLTVRGTIFATGGEIGGWTITEDMIYATDNGGIIQTGEDVGIGSDGVVLDRNGLRVYNSILGIVANFPSDGSVPTISSGIINEVTFELSTNAVIRTSETVGDGTSESFGILINNTGIYGCGANQLIEDANLKVLADGRIFLKGEIIADSGTIGGVSIQQDRLVGGVIQGALLIGAVIETSESMPRIRIDEDGLAYQVTSGIGEYGEFNYGDGTLYGTGVLAKLFDTNYPVLSVLSEQAMADIRLYDRANFPVTGTHALGDLICKDGAIYRCLAPGSPGTWIKLLTSNIGNVVYLSEN